MTTQHTSNACVFETHSVRRATVWALATAAILCGSSLAIAQSTTTKSIRISSAKGGTVEVLIDRAQSAEPSPTVVIAPGQGYHARLPLFQKLARQLSQGGITVYRFNWAYFVRDPKTLTPSSELVDENADMAAVIETARADPLVDPQRIALAGKSLGSLVAWKAFQTIGHAQAVVLLTPICNGQTENDRDAAIEKNYPQLAKPNRAMMVVMGHADPLCATGTVFRKLGSSVEPARVSILGGAHSFETRGNEAASEADLEAAVSSTVHFLNSHLKK